MLGMVSHDKKIFQIVEHLQNVCVLCYGGGRLYLLGSCFWPLSVLVLTIVDGLWCPQPSRTTVPEMGSSLTGEWSDIYDANTLLIAPTLESFARPCKPASGANYRTKTTTWNDSEHWLMECSLRCEE